MADNYLEKAMEDLRSGRMTATSGVRSSALRSRSQRKSAPLAGEHYVFIGDIDADEATSRRIDEWLRQGATVDFIYDDPVKGYHSAQRHGCRFYPVDSLTEEEINRRLEEIRRHRAASNLTIQK